MISPRFRWNLIVASIIMVFIVSLPLLFIATGRRALHRELNAWLTIGGKGSFAELAPEPLADEENAALLYQEAAEALDLLFKSEAADWISAPGDDPDLDEHIATCSEVLQKIHEASRLERAVWMVDFSIEGADIFNVPLPHLGQMRHLASLLRAEAVDHASKGKHDEAFRSIQAIQKLATHLEGGAFFVDHRVSVAVNALAVGAFKEIFREHELPADAGVTDLFDRSMISLVPQVILNEGSAFAEVLMDRKAAQRVGLRHRRYTYPFFADRATAEYLAYMRFSAKNFSKPYWEQDSWSGFDTQNTSLGAMAEFFMHPFDQWSQVTTRIDVRFALASQAILLRQHRGEHGRYPDPGHYQTLIDPYAGIPLHYELTESGFLLRSEMEDGKGQREEWEWN